VAVRPLDRRLPRQIAVPVGITASYGIGPD